jgi:hypothetical protein
MSAALVLIPIGVAGAYFWGESMMAKHSRWDLLAKSYAAPGTPPSKWNSCRFLQFEYQEGNKIKRTIYRPPHKPGGGFSLMQVLFPHISVAVGPRGLYFKRPPWHFKHPALLIPWEAIAKVEEVSGSDFAAQSLPMGAIPGGAEAWKKAMPGAVSGFFDRLGGPTVHLHLVAPDVKISILAQVIQEARPYLAAKQGQKKTA